jgi:hypothetical protein
MADEVWKFQLPMPDQEPWIEMPKGARLLHVAAQHGVPCVWALVQPQADRVRRHVVIYATGQSIDGSPTYLGTFHIEWTVWHVFFTNTEHTLGGIPL